MTAGKAIEIGRFCRLLFVSSQFEEHGTALSHCHSLALDVAKWSN